MTWQEDERKRYEQAKVVREETTRQQLIEAAKRQAEGLKPMSEREPGRPRIATRRHRIDITLSNDIIRYIDEHPISRSQFIEQCVKEHRERENK